VRSGPSSGNPSWLWATLVVAGLLAVAVGLRAEPTRLRTGPTQPVTDDPQLAINTNTSPVAVADPRRPGVLVAVGRVDAPRLNCTVSASTTGGEAWRPLDLPLPAGASNCFWPDVAFDGDGNLLVLYTPTTGPYQLPQSLWLQRFGPDLALSGPPVQVAGALTFQPRLSVVGPQVLVAWIQAGPARADKPLGFPPPPNPIVLVRSDDGGRTFAPPVVVSEADRLAVQPTLLALPGGRILLGALDLGDDRETYESAHRGLPGPPPATKWRVVAWMSGDGGRTFGAAQGVSGDVVPVQRVLIDLAPAPDFAVDLDRNRIYATWESDHDVLLSQSDDAGSSWSPARRVGPTKGGQFLPGVGVSPRGRVDVAFYDRGRDPGDLLAEVVVASSADGGHSFAAEVVSEQPFDSTVGSFNGDTIMLGSHLAVVSQDDRATVVWADAARGNRVNNIVDLVSAAVTVKPGRGRAAPVVVAGAVIALLGCALTARSWLGRGAARGRSSGRHRGAWPPPPRPG